MTGSNTRKATNTNNNLRNGQNHASVSCTKQFHKQKCRFFFLRFSLEGRRLRCKFQLHYLDWSSTSARIWLQRSVQVVIRSYTKQWKQAAALWCCVKDSRSYSHQYGQSFRNLNVRLFPYYHVKLSTKLLLMSYM